MSHPSTGFPQRPLWALVPPVVGGVELKFHPQPVVPLPLAAPAWWLLGRCYRCGCIIREGQPHGYLSAALCCRGCYEAVVAGNDDAACKAAAR